MSKEQIQAKLHELGIDHDGRWSIERLSQLLENSTDQELTEITASEIVESPIPNPPTRDLMLSNVKHNGIQHKKGEYVKLPGKDRILFKQKGWIA